MRIPMSLGPPREDLDKNGEVCTVYDVVFHPDAVEGSLKEAEFRSFVMQRARSWEDHFHKQGHGLGCMPVALDEGAAGRLRWQLRLLTAAAAVAGSPSTHTRTHTMYWESPHGSQHIYMRTLLPLARPSVVLGASLSRVRSCGLCVCGSDGASGAAEV